MRPLYDLDKIKFATDGPTFERAVGLYESGKIKRFREDLNGFFATVLGTRPYEVYVDRRHYDIGDCECYLGRNSTLCKHMVAVAICAVQNGRPLSDEDKKNFSEPVCSGRPGTLDRDGLSVVKKSVTDAMKYIKPYNGPSRLWFAYQNSLSEGCNRLAKIVSDLPVGKQTADLLVDLLLRLDNKLRGAVDDSDGTVGDFITGAVEVLEKYVELDPSCAAVFRELEGKETFFGWEEPLLKFK